MRKFDPASFVRRGEINADGSERHAGFGGGPLCFGEPWLGSSVQHA